MLFPEAFFICFNHDKICIDKICQHVYDKFKEKRNYIF